MTKTYDGGLADRHYDCKEVWVFPNEECPERCPVRLIEKYLALCPKYDKKSNLYLQSLQKPSPHQWYAEQVIGTHTISKVVTELMHKAKIEGFFTNHSLRHSGGTCLFRGGVDHKLVKESTGHRSDAVDTYQVTSMQQREMMSKILHGQNVRKKGENVAKTDKAVTTETSKKGTSVEFKCMCQSSNQQQLGEIIAKLVKENNHKGKVIVKVEIELHNE